MADALDLGSSVPYVWVQVPHPAPIKTLTATLMQCTGKYILQGVLYNLICRCGGIGRRLGLKIRWGESPVPVRVWSPAPVETFYSGHQLSWLEPPAHNRQVLGSRPRWPTNYLLKTLTAIYNIIFGKYIVKIGLVYAGVVQWQNSSLPSWSRGFDSHHPLQNTDWSLQPAVSRLKIRPYSNVMQRSKQSLTR